MKEGKINIDNSDVIGSTLNITAIRLQAQIQNSEFNNEVNIGCYNKS